MQLHSMTYAQTAFSIGLVLVEQSGCVRLPCEAKLIGRVSQYQGQTQQAHEAPKHAGACSCYQQALVEGGWELHSASANASIQSETEIGNRAVDVAQGKCHLH